MPHWCIVRLAIITPPCDAVLIEDVHVNRGHELFCHITQAFHSHTVSLQSPTAASLSSSAFLTGDVGSPISILPRCYSFHTILLAREFLGEVGGLGRAVLIVIPGGVHRGRDCRQGQGEICKYLRGPCEGSLAVDDADDMVGVVDEKIVVAKVAVAKGKWAAVEDREPAG